MTVPIETGIHVSVDGLDSHAGTADHPVQTLSRALELAGESDGPVTVWLGDGIHSISETVRIPSRGTGGTAPSLTIRASRRRGARR